MTVVALTLFMATMQSVVIGQAPITLERKITSRGKQKKTEDNVPSILSDKKKSKTQEISVCTATARTQERQHAWGIRILRARTERGGGV